MKELELVSGTGTLLLDSREWGAASYEIIPGSVGTTAQGKLTADPLALDQAASARSITLRLADGTELEITITRVDRDRAEIKLKPPAQGSSEL